MRSNLSVGPPLELLLYRRDSFTMNLRQRLVEDDHYLQIIRRECNETPRSARISESRLVAGR